MFGTNANARDHIYIVCSDIRCPHLHLFMKHLSLFQDSLNVNFHVIFSLKIDFHSIFSLTIDFHAIFSLKIDFYAIFSLTIDFRTIFSLFFFVVSLHCVLPSAPLCASKSLPRAFLLVTRFCAKSLPCERLLSNIQLLGRIILELVTNCDNDLV